VKRLLRGAIRRSGRCALLCGALLAGVGTAAGAPPGTKELFPNDPSVLQSPAPYRQIEAPAFWAATVDKPCGVRVAVLDSQPAPNADLALEPGANFAPGTGNTPHGTQVASVVSARIGNGVGIAGMTDCPIVPARVMDPTGYWQNDWLTAAIDWAASQPGVRVLNLSLWQTAGQGQLADVSRAIQAATARGVLVVLIAGNGASNNAVGSSSPSANPLAAANPAAIRVAGVGPSGGIHPASNRGAALADIAAPFAMPVGAANGSWSAPGGTSYGAPAVAAVAAELFNLNPSLTPAQAKAVLMSSGTRVAGLDVACACILNAYQALIGAGYRPPSTLTVSIGRSGDGKGVVTASGTRCPPTCSLGAFAGDEVRLVAEPEEGSRFVGWGGACSGSDPTCVLRPAGDATVTVTFARQRVRFVVKRRGRGTVTGPAAGIACGRRCVTPRLAWGATVRLAAKPARGWRFVRWGGVCRGTRPTCVARPTSASVALVVFARKAR
jgi:Subtilase family/Divergent InlB B-repeat domain